VVVAGSREDRREVEGLLAGKADTGDNGHGRDPTGRDALRETGGWLGSVAPVRRSGLPANRLV
jgi:hypothetical protein